MILALIVVAVFVPHVCGQSVDKTLVSRETGSAVVDAVVDRITLSCVFDNDKLMLRRLAKVESDDGATLVEADNYGGGIWKIRPVDHTLLRTKGFLYFNPILQNFGFDISKARYTDFEKPLYSGLAASIKLAVKTKTTGIPWSCTDQASTWTDVYVPGTTTFDKQTYLDLCNTQENCEVSKADIVIVMDESGSIGASNFDLVKQFVVDVVGAFDLSPNGVRIGIIKYSKDTTTVVRLGAVTTTAAVQDRVRNIVYGQGGTRTDLALLKMQDMFQTGRGSQGVPQIGIVITDGKSNDADALDQAVQAISGESYTIFSVGVTSGAVEAELEQYGSDPDCVHVTILEQFSDMSDFVQQIQQLACKAPAELPEGQPIEGEIEEGEFIYFKLVVKRTANGVTIKLKMSSGSCKMYLSFKVRNPGPAIYDYFQEVTSSSSEGGWMYLPWPTEVSLDETYLYGALEGGPRGLGVGNQYVLEYTEGRFNGAGTQRLNVLMIVSVALAYWVW